MGEKVLWGSPPMPEFPECWYVGGYSEALQVLKSPAFVHDRSKVSGLIPLADFSGEGLTFWRQIAEWPLFLDAPEHTAKRQVVGSYFREGAILQLEQFIKKETETLLDAALSKKTIDIMWDIAYPLTLAVICHLIGLNPPEIKWFKSRVRSLADTMDLRTGIHDYQPSLATVKDFYSFFATEIKERPSDKSLLGYMLGNGISQEDVLPILLQLLFAGQETSADAIGMSVITLADNPEAHQTLVKKPELIENAVREILRVESPIQYSGIRIATQDKEIGGKHIRRGDCVLIAIAACNKDDRHFIQPNTVDFTRDNNGPDLSFGHGIHYCLGVHLARLEIRIVLQTLLRKLPENWHIESYEMRKNILFKGPTSLKIKLGL
ncbi:MAG: cytochrome P450 [Methylophilaceae bacterium]|nr:cytochrome P450 [Methyloradius sp.]